MAQCISSRERSRRAVRVQGSLTLLIGLALASAALADDEGGPVLLTNADIARVRTEAQSNENPPGLILTGPSSVTPSTRPGAVTPPARAASESPSPEAGSWQEEYYRLKAIALREALDRGDAVDFSDGIEGVASTAPLDEGPPITLPTAAPSCMYGQYGTLIHEPEGVRCNPLRSRSHARPSPAERHDSCVYGHEGEVIYAPAGVRCDRH